MQTDSTTHTAEWWVCLPKPFTLPQKTSNWEQTVSERDETVTGERGPLRAGSQHRGPGLALTPAPSPAPAGSSGLLWVTQEATQDNTRSGATQRPFTADTVQTQPTVKCEGEREAEWIERQLSVRSKVQEEEDEEEFATVGWSENSANSWKQKCRLHRYTVDKSRLHFKAEETLYYHFNIKPYWAAYTVHKQLSCPESRCGSWTWISYKG